MKKLSHGDGKLAVACVAMGTEQSYRLSQGAAGLASTVSMQAPICGDCACCAELSIPFTSVICLPVLSLPAGTQIWSCGKKLGLRGRWILRTSRWPVMRTQVRWPRWFFSPPHCLTTRPGNHPFDFGVAGPLPLSLQEPHTHS